MNPDPERIITGIIEREGREFTDHPQDAGGPTKFGITQRTLSDYLGRQASIDDVRNMTEGHARDVYRHKYIRKPGFLPLLQLWGPLGEEVIDSGVNCGVQRATEWLQRSLNAFNRNGRDWPDIPVDGDCGPRTIAAVRALLSVRGAAGIRVLLRALNALQGAYYIEISERRSANEAFTFGWFDHRVGF